MAINLSALSSVTTAAGALSGLVLVSPQNVVGYQPQNPPNADGTPSTAKAPPSLLFTYEGEQALALTSDITNHYVDTNTSRQDQISLKPEEYTVRGFIGELNDKPPALLAPVRTLAEKLGAISSYTPGLSVTALLAYQQAFFLYQVAANVANSAVSAWSSVGNLITGSNGQSVIGDTGLVAASAQNDQQTMFQQFYGYWTSRTLFTVQTPWCVFQNMAIKSLRVIQDEKSQQESDFEITFQRIRYAKSTLSSNSLISFGARAASQAAGIKDFGASVPAPAQSVSSAIGGMFA